MFLFFLSQLFFKLISVDCFFEEIKNLVNLKKYIKDNIKNV